MKTLIFVALLLVCQKSFAQYSLKGDVTDTVGDPIAFTTVSLLQPTDSTLAFFGITNASGTFEVKNVSKGSYLMQVAFMGFKTFYKTVDIPYSKGENFGRIVLLPLTKQLQEVNVTGEKIPMLIKRDTIEYNAGAFKTKPDASVEELLKKMPGIDVDHSGNIKAQGEDIRKVLVDGKEFFGDDPKVATKNLPADAINKVQVFNRKSDAAEFTGIDDGSREKTINLVLKDGKKAGYFGDVQAGGGTDEKYKLNGKLYKFRQTSQFAAIGMLNNINQAGFSFRDYLNLNGGIRSLMDAAEGGQAMLNFDEGMPVDFGRPVNGLINSGAVGLNYSYEPRKNNRLSVSYLGNGSDKDLRQQVTTQNLTEQGTFLQNDNISEHSQNFAHRVNLTLRKDIDSSNQLTFNGNASLTDGKANTNRLSASLVRDVLINNLDSRVLENGDGFRSNGRFSYLHNSKSKWPVWRLSGDGGYERNLTQTEWRNITTVMPAQIPVNDRQYLNDQASRLQVNGTASVTRALGKGRFLEPEIRAGYNIQTVIRQQGALETAAEIDSLSPDYNRIYSYVRPGIGFRRAAEKTQMSLNLRAESGVMNTELNGLALDSKPYVYLLPSFNWQNEYANSKRLNVGYNSAVNLPSAAQMTPVYNNMNPLQRFIGNSDLKPEYSHRANVNWIRFDQFNFTSLFVNLTGSYTVDKISTARFVNADLIQTLMPVNTPYKADVAAGVEYSMPVRKLGVNLTASLNESFEQGISRIDHIDNTTNVWTHGIKLSASNRKKEKIDVQAGGSIGFTDATYSINKNLNSQFYNWSAFAEINYRPFEFLNFQTVADITQYNAQSFSSAVIVPILKAEVSYYFLKAKRGTITLEGFDLLNMNKGLERISELNYLRETTSNTIARYFMLSFKYKLGKNGSGSADNMDIKINGR